MSATVKRLLSPAEWLDRQINTLTSVGRANYKVGIRSPKADPIERGKATEDKYGTQTQKAIADKRRLHGLERTDMAEWFKYSDTLGAEKLVDGVTKRKDKVKDAIDTLQPLFEAHLANIDKLPEDTDGERETKMLENRRGLIALKGKA